MLLAVALGGCFVLEQPGSSVLEFYPAFRHVMSSLVLVSGVDSEGASVLCVHEI